MPTLSIKINQGDDTMTIKQTFFLPEEKQALVTLGTSPSASYYEVEPGEESVGYTTITVDTTIAYSSSPRQLEFTSAYGISFTVLDPTGAGEVSTVATSESLDALTLPTATVAATDKVIIKDADDSDTAKTVTAQSVADLKVPSEAEVVSALDGATLTAATVAGTDKVLVQDADDSDNIKTVTAQSIADLNAGAGGEGAEAWINYHTDFTAAINDSFNITSITDNGTGDITITIATDFANTNYATVLGGQGTSETADNLPVLSTFSKAVGSIRLRHVNVGNLATTSTIYRDLPDVSAVFFGDQ